MDEIEKYETYMRGAFSMLNFIREELNKSNFNYLEDDMEERILTPCEHQYKTALDLFHEAIKLKDKERV